ncbi:hypothetical protein [Cystobacter fuscus]|uniref:hypothetical protein n=1 Tax=Cystobacter fuscus TaxID=43 RepID=UPI002B2C6BC3|nr:hypothetical protein F0U63_14990 [Cystobacter fuscus]
MARGNPTPGVEVQGPIVQALIASVEIVRPEVLRILASHGISASSPRPGYPLPEVLRCLDDIQGRVGRVTVRAIGQQVPRHTAFPPHITSFAMALFLMNAAYRTNHQGAEHIGGYHHEPVDGQSSRMRCDNPYPCDFNQGVLEGLYARFTGRGTLRLRIEHETEDCRTRGATACTYRLKW